MQRKFATFFTILIVLSLLFSSTGNSALYAAPAETTNSPTGWFAVVIGVATVIAALPVVQTGWDSWACWRETGNHRTTTYGSKEYGTKYYNSSMARYTYESPGTNFAILRDTRMDGILNSGLNNAIKAKINVDVLGGTKYVERKSYSFSTNRSVQRAYSRATLTKYTFDVYKKCLIGGKTLVLGATWFVAPSASHAYYVELR